MRKLILIALTFWFYTLTFAQGIGEYMEEGRKLENESKYKKAIEKYNQALKLAPNTAEIYFLRGRAYYRGGNNKKGIEDFSTAIAFNPDKPEYYRWRGWAYYNQNKYQEAIQDYNLGLAKNPANPEDFYNEQGLILHSQEKYKKAVQKFTQAATADPDSPIIISNRGESKYRSGDLEGALEDYKKAFEIKPDLQNARIFNFMGLIQRDLENYEEAISYFDKAIEVSPEGVYYYNRGLTNLDANNQNMACNDFAISLSKGFADAKEYLSAVYCEGNYNPNAGKYFYVDDRIGLLADASIQSLERKLKVYDDSTSTQIHIAIIKSLNGEKIEDYSIKLAQSKGIGQKNKDNGVLILVVKDDRKMRIEVGYGLEAKLTDATCQKIIDNIMKPEFRNQDFYAGLNNAVDKIIGILAGSFSPDDIRKVAEPLSWSWWDFIIIGLGGLVLVFIFGAGHWIAGIIAAVVIAITYFLDYGLYGFFAIPFFFLYIGAIKAMYEESKKVKTSSYSSSSSSYTSSSSSSSSSYSDYSSSYSDSYSDYSSSYSDSSWGGGSFGGGGASGDW